MYKQVWCSLLLWVHLSSWCTYLNCPCSKTVPHFCTSVYIGTFWLWGPRVQVTHLLQTLACEEWGPFAFPTLGATSNHLFLHFFKLYCLHPLLAKTGFSEMPCDVALRDTCSPTSAFSIHISSSSSLSPTKHTAWGHSVRYKKANKKGHISFRCLKHHWETCKK